MKDVMIKADKSLAEVEYERLFNAKKELLQLVIYKTFGQLKDTSKIKKMKKEVVRLKSV